MDHYKEELDRKKAKVIRQKQDDFLAYVIKNWVAEMQTEQSIQLEFMN